jgi:hypothetical protein
MHRGEALHTSTVARRPLQFCLEDRILFMLLRVETTFLEVHFTIYLRLLLLFIQKSRYHLQPKSMVLSSNSPHVKCTKS